MTPPAGRGGIGPVAAVLTPRGRCCARTPAASATDSALRPPSSIASELGGLLFMAACLVRMVRRTMILEGWF